MEKQILKQIKTSLSLDPEAKEKLLKLVNSGKVSEYGQWMLETAIKAMDEKFKMSLKENMTKESYEDFLSYSKEVFKKISKESEVDDRAEDNKKLKNLEDMLTEV